MQCAAAIGGEKRGHRLTALLLILACLALMSGGIVPRARAQGGIDPARRFGVIGGADRADDLRALGVGWQQVAFEWAAFQPGGPGDFDAEAVDPAWLAAANQDGREIVGQIIGTPGWASDSVPDGLALPVDDPGNVWAAFVARLVGHYAPLGVHHWVIYDAPDVRRGEGRVRFAGGVADYARLVAAASQAAKAVDPGAVIHLAAFDWWTDVAAGREPYLARLLRVLDGESFDAATVRVVTGTQAIWDMVAAVRSLLGAAGAGGTPIWLEVDATPDPGALLGVTPGQQADLAVQAAAISLVAGAARLALADAASLFDSEGARRPAFDAYRDAIWLFAPTQNAVHLAHPLIDLIIMEQADRVLYVAWTRGTTPARLVITSPAAGEPAWVFAPDTRYRAARSEPVEWPAAFEVDLPAAQVDAHGFLTAAGSPRVLALDRVDDFFRVVYLVVNGDYVRLR